jgi:hypothetical protein
MRASQLLTIFFATLASALPTADVQATTDVTLVEDAEVPASLEARAALVCHTTTWQKLWGQNKESALLAAQVTCLSRSSNGAPNGVMRLQHNDNIGFWINAKLGNNEFFFNFWNAQANTRSLPASECIQLLYRTVNECSRGGDGEENGYRFGFVLKKLLSVCEVRTN